MDSTTIRRTFLEFFEERGHAVRPSASLIPIDPTLLLTNAGMVPFKPYFLGEEPAPYKRAVSIQKSVRTIDIDIIGTTVRHMSFFEMLGNFSFGDYFKKEAMAWANDLMIKGFGLDPDRLWYTAYEDDDEAAASVGRPRRRCLPIGSSVVARTTSGRWACPDRADPCAEIFYDRGPEYGADGGPIGGGEERFVEIWNLVFMQNVQDRAVSRGRGAPDQEHRHRYGARAPRHDPPRSQARCSRSTRCCPCAPPPSNSPGPPTETTRWSTCRCASWPITAGR